MTLRRRGYLVEGKLNWGFDHTDFPAGMWEKMMKQVGLPTKAKKKSRSYKTYTGEKRSTMEFFFSGPGLTVQTYYDPVTGENPSGGQGKRKGFAGYIGITGDADKVKKLVGLIKKHGTIKDESPRKREFI